MSGTNAYVIDTSSVIDVRRLMSTEPVASVTGVYARLLGLVARGVVHVPHAVIDELIHGATGLTKKGAIDHPGDWAKNCRSHSVATSDLLTYAVQVLAIAPRLIDPDRVSVVDEADPYVVGLALRLADVSALRVTVVTDDRKDSPRKTSVASACGLMRIPVISARVFLEALGLFSASG